MRLIDADVMLARLEEWNTSDLTDKALYNFTLHRILEQPTIEPQQRWIPCSERLPDEGQKCLVCDKGSIGIDTYIGHGNPYNWKWYTRDYEAWMPLPEPYKGGDAE